MFHQIKRRDITQTWRVGVALPRRGLIDGWMKREREGERIDQKMEEEVEKREGPEVSDVRTSAVCLLHSSAI